MTGEDDADERCAGHPGLSGEFRTMVLTVMDRIEPLIERARTEPVTATAATTCAICPICAVLAVLRGERTELAVRMAEHAAGLIAVLRAALEEGEGARPAPAQPNHRHGPRRTVQHIPVVRTRPRG